MADASIITTWGMAAPGRESMALAVFQEVIGFHEQHKAKGNIEDFKVGLAEAGAISHHGGYMIAEGSAAKIAELQESEAYKRLLTKASHCVTDIHVARCATGTGIPAFVERILGVRKELGI